MYNKFKSITQRFGTTKLKLNKNPRGKFLGASVSYNFARKEYHVDDRNYPFGKGKIQIKFPESEKIGLNKEEVQLLETADNLTKAQLHAVYVWLTSFYFAGVRVADVIKLKWSDFKDNRLYYRMGKNRKLVSLVVPDKTKEILKYLFNLL